MIDEKDRIIVFSPHPDDDILGCGGIISYCVKNKIPIKIVYLTYGDSNELSFLKYNRWKLPVLRPNSIKKMGEMRRREAINACQQFGLVSDNLIFLGYPDFGTMKIWCKHWKTSPPLKGLFSRADFVPYNDAFRPNASYKGEEILKDIKAVIKEFQPTKIFCSHRNDHHSDHQALYLYIRLALFDLKDQISVKLFPFLIHYNNWPPKLGYNPSEQLNPPKNITSYIRWEKFNLNDETKSMKYSALQLHKSQFTTNSNYLSSFVKDNELFGDYEIINKETKEVIQSGSVNTIYDSLDNEGDEEFFGLSSHSFNLTNDYLIQNVKLTHLFGTTAEVTIYVFPYSYSTPYSELPKFRIKIRKNDYSVHNLYDQINEHKVRLSRDTKNNQLQIEIPLSFLNNPNILFISVKSEIGNITIDWVPWRIIHL